MLLCLGGLSHDVRMWQGSMGMGKWDWTGLDWAGPGWAGARLLT